MWDVLAGKPVGNPITGNTGAVASIAMAVASDGRCHRRHQGDDDTVRVWDVLADTPLDPLTGHDGSSRCCGRGQHARRTRDRRLWAKTDRSGLGRHFPYDGWLSHWLGIVTGSTAWR